MPDRKPQRRKQAEQSRLPQFQPQTERTSSWRQVDKREIVERFLIVCEGENTEPDYFREFRVPGRVVDIDGAGRNTLSLVDETVRLTEEARLPYDQVWCAFDRDSFRADDFNSAISKAKAAGFHIAYTNEAFELWYLLHFNDHRSALSRTGYIDKLKEILGAYAKNKENSQMMYTRLLDRQEQAIERAESLLAEYGFDHNPQRDNPSTTVHLLVKALCANVTPRRNQAG